MIILFSLIIIFFLTVLQVAVIDLLANNFFIFNLPLIIIIFINWARPSYHSLLFTIATSWGLAYFSVLTFSLVIYSYFITACLVQYISLNKLTNRNLVSLIIAGLAGSFLYHATLLAVKMIDKQIPLRALEEMIFSPSALATHLLILSGMLFILKLNVFKHETREIKVGF